MPANQQNYQNLLDMIKKQMTSLQGLKGPQYDQSGADSINAQIAKLMGLSGPQFGDTAGAFDKREAAASAAQTQETARNQASQLEKAAAQGKTMSSAQTAASSRIGQEGTVNLQNILSALGLQEQQQLSDEASQTAGFNMQRDTTVTGLQQQLEALTSGQAEKSAAFGLDKEAGMQDLLSLLQEVQSSGPGGGFGGAGGGGAGGGGGGDIMELISGAGGAEAATNPFQAMLQKAIAGLAGGPSQSGQGPGKYGFPGSGKPASTYTDVQQYNAQTSYVQQIQAAYDAWIKGR